MTTTTTRALLVAALTIAGGTAQAQKVTGGAPAADPAPPSPAPTSPAAPATPAAPASGLVAASDPQSVVDAMQRLGYAATLGADNVGDPLITGTILGSGYSVFFYGCAANADCQSLLFQVGYDLPDGWTLEAANEWNAGKILTDAYLDAEADPYLEYFVATSGGLNQENFAAVLDWWQVTMADFETTIGF